MLEWGLVQVMTGQLVEDSSVGVLYIGGTIIVLY